MEPVTMALIATAAFQGFQAITGQQQQQQALKAQSEYRRKVSALNNRIAAIQVGEALARGEEKISEIRFA